MLTEKIWECIRSPINNNCRTDDDPKPALKEQNYKCSHCVLNRGSFISITTGKGRVSLSHRGY